MRQGANVIEVTSRVKRKLMEIAPGLPAGVRVVPVYDRSDLIHRVIDNLRSTLVGIILTVVLVILLFLWHPPSALIPILTIPITVLAVAGPVPSDRPFVRCDVSGWNRHRDWRAGGRSHRCRGADPQEAGGMAGGRETGQRRTRSSWER